MRSAASGHSYALGNGVSSSGPGPAMLTICGFSLNAIPAYYRELVPVDFRP